MTSTARRKWHNTPTQSHPLSLHPQPDSLGDAGTVRASSDHWRIAALWLEQKAEEPELKGYWAGHIFIKKGLYTNAPKY